MRLVAPSEQHRNFVATLLLHASDVSNCARPWKIIEKKTPLIMEEFFQQAELEESLGASSTATDARTLDDSPSTAKGWRRLFVCVPLL